MFQNFRYINLLFFIGIVIQLSIIYLIYSKDVSTNKILMKFEQIIQNKTSDVISSIKEELSHKEEQLIKEKNKNKSSTKIELQIKKLPIEIKIYDKNKSLKNEYSLPNWAIGLSIGDHIEIKEGK